MKKDFPFSSSLALTFRRYVELKRALGRDFSNQSRVLHSLDRFMSDPANRSPNLTSRVFQRWCRTQEKLASGMRRSAMRMIYNFCIYRRRTEPHCFVPDPSSFPLPHQRITPYIVSESDAAQLLAASQGLRQISTSPVRREVIRLAIALLYTTGMRHGELLRLTVSDYDSKEGTLLIRESKFHKSRVLPLHHEMVNEINHYFQLRRNRRLQMSPGTPLIWNSIGGGRPYTGTGLRENLRILFNRCKIRTAQGKLPRVHDFRHGFTVNTLLRWYRAGVDVNAKLPFLATYLGHVSIESTYYYLQFVEPLRMLASKRFADRYGKLVRPPNAKRGYR
jgi:integrase/recombinase XerD